MNKRLQEIVLGGLMIASLFTGIAIVAPQPASAIEISVCTFIGPICDAIDSGTGLKLGNAQNFLQSRLTAVLGLVFIGIILISVFVIVRAGIKYIQSQGDPGKIAEAQKAITSVFVGIAILFVGIVGLVLILGFFNFLAPLSSTCTVNADGTLSGDCTSTSSSGNTPATGGTQSQGK